MFGIGFPELILILALALIVVGPDKLPEMARSVAKTLLDLKKTAEGLKDSIEIEDNPLSEIKPELEDAARNFKKTILDAETQTWKEDTASSPEEEKHINDIYDDYANIVSEGEAQSTYSRESNEDTGETDSDSAASPQNQPPSADQSSRQKKAE